MVFSRWMGWQMENSENLMEKALLFALKTLSFGCSLQYWGIWGRGQGGMPLSLKD
jgi:hypothetical protein